jgi:hypothetical protein
MSGPSRFAAFILVATLPAHAEIDFRRDPHAADDLALISSCIDVATSWETTRDCANVTYQGCIARIDGNVSHAAQADCNIRERDLWMHLYSLDALKIEAWTLLKDRQMRAAGDDRVIAHDLFRRFSDAWKDYLAYQCQMEVADYGTGNGKMTDQPICEITVIADGLLKLRALHTEMSSEPVP